MVCLGCGKSVRKIRHHNVSMECALLAALYHKILIICPHETTMFAMCGYMWLRTTMQQLRNRTVGCCCHVMTIIWYLGWARHQNNIQAPAGFIDNILLTIPEY